MGHYDEKTGTFDYMAGVAVEKAVALPAGMAQWEVPASTYAVFEATLPTIGQVFGDIYNTWLPTSGYQQAAGPNFEHYGETFNPDDPTSILSIYIPVEKNA
jgi:AraC family transcriptional regulator